MELWKLCQKMLKTLHIFGETVKEIGYKDKFDYNYNSNLVLLVAHYVTVSHVLYVVTCREIY